MWCCLTADLCVCVRAFLQVLDKDFTLPIGKAKIMRPGKHVTLIAFSKMVGYNLKVAEQLAQEGIEAEVRVVHMAASWVGMGKGSMWTGCPRQGRVVLRWRSCCC